MDALTVFTEWFTVPLGFDFVRRALLVSVVAGVACAVLSCWMTLVGWSLMGDAVSHAVLPGVVLSYLFGLPFAVGALVFGAGSVALIGAVNRTSRVKEDAVIGVVFTAMFALGLVLVSRVPSQTDLGHILFGNVLGVSDTDIRQVLVLAGVVLAVVWYKHRDLTLYAFDPVHAHAVGINPRLLETLLLGLLSVTVVVALQAVGIILVVAMVIVPGATAYLLTDRFERMLVISSAVAVAAAAAGVFTSFHLNVSTGGAIVLAQSAAFTLAYLFSPGQGVLRRGRPARGFRARSRRGPRSEEGPAPVGDRS
jgi:manganese transport system permease protein